MGNSCGDTEDYFQVMERHAGACGGFVWSGAIIPLFAKLKQDGLWRDFNDTPNDGNFVLMD